MAHCDGRGDGVESSTTQQIGNPVEHDKDASKTYQVNKTDEITSVGDKSWIVLQAEDITAEKDQSNSYQCFIGSNEDYSLGECLLTQNSTQGLPSSELNAMPYPFIDSEVTDVKEVIGTASGQHHNVLAPSDLSSSRGSVSVCSTQPDYYCDVCELIDLALPSQDSIDFWRKVPRKGLDETGCHIKFLEKFIVTLKEFSKAEKLLADTKVINLLKRLLKVDLADETAVVEYKNFARLVKYLGPVRPNDCVMVQQIRCIKEASIAKDRRSKEKISWFAGEMSRKEAEGLLNEKSPGTYLVRMSQTVVGAFVISVKHGDSVVHVEVSGDYRNAITTATYNARLSLNGNTYTSLVEAVNSLRTNPLKIIEDAEEEDRDSVGEDDGHGGERNEIGERSSDDIFCRFCCPDLPLNGVISGYKKTPSRR
ncbi:GRB2-related adapter protein 2 [Mizuhopecten yessoensis]|uniref:GRB2-related adapter protein 2 n=2 Tax=Mizuhopecten yessoensis TaxID=6573 RepID=A0A210PY00_MIZYE|nr:GRB2-related adapter protein 2 [Mizuhopecten yessoensis]